MTKDNGSMKLPLARPGDEFVIEVLADEVLVYDKTRHVAHCLTPAAALVWQRCDGRTSRADAVAALVVSGSRDSLDDVLAQLSAAALIVAPARAPRDTVNASRRRMLGKTMVAAGVIIASPVVYSILAPSVAEAASVCGKSGQDCCTTGRPCNVPLTCAGSPATCH